MQSPRAICVSLSQISIVPTSGALGFCQSDDLFQSKLLGGLLEEPPILEDGMPVMSQDAWRAQRRAATEQHVVADLAGLASEWRRARVPRVSFAFALRELPGASEAVDDDLSRAAHQLAAFEPDEGRREKWICELWDRAWRLTGTSWRDIEKVASALLARKTLELEELAALLLRA